VLADDAQPPRAGARAMVPSGVVLGNPTRRIAPRQPRPTLDLWSQTLRTRTPLLRGVSCPVRARCPGQSRTCLRLVQVVRVNRQPQPDSCPTPRLRYRLQRRRRPTGAFLRGDPSPRQRTACRTITGGLAVSVHYSAWTDHLIEAARISVKGLPTSRWHPRGTRRQPTCVQAIWDWEA